MLSLIRSSGETRAHRSPSARPAFLTACRLLYSNGFLPPFSSAEFCSAYLALFASDGVAATEEILKSSPGTKVILLTSADSSDIIARGLKAGARGAILKSADFTSLVSTINAVFGGEEIIAPEIKRLLSDDPPLTDLTARQQDILQAIVRGLYDKDIARELGISVYTVKEHVNALFAKIGASNRTEAVAIALRKHLLKA